MSRAHSLTNRANRALGRVLAKVAAWYWHARELTSPAMLEYAEAAERLARESSVHFVRSVTRMAFERQKLWPAARPETRALYNAAKRLGATHLNAAWRAGDVQREIAARLEAEAAQ